MTYRTSRFDEAFIAESEASTDFVVVFDKDLKYLYANPTVCAHLGRKFEDLQGHSIIDLYPDIIASRNHRNLLKALTGASIREPIEGRNRVMFEAVYTPVFKGKEVDHVVVRAKKL